MAKKRNSRSKGRRRLRFNGDDSGRIKFRLIAFCLAAFAGLIIFFIARDAWKKAHPPARRPAVSRPVRRIPAERPRAPYAEGPRRAPLPVPARPEVPLPPVRTPVLQGVTFTQEEINRPKIVFVIDDIGYHTDFENQLRALGTNVTYSVLPMLPYSEHFGKVGGEVGTEVILHQPMESVNGTIPGRGLITGAMPPEQMLSVLNANLANVPNHVGLNNHMGSLGTVTPQVMNTVLGELRREGLIFLDSRTNSKTIGPEVARGLGMTVLIRDVFLDNEDSKPYILGQIEQLEPIALKRGYAIGIGHYRKNTLELLAEEIPKLKQKGFAIVSLRKLAAMKEKGLLD